VHGVAFAVGSATLARTENPVLGDLYFFVLVAPALLLAKPFSWLLRDWHLMEAPGWFAWPRPAGFALVYVVWVLALLAVSLLARRIGARRR
jgi:hypothetical protein